MAEHQSWCNKVQEGGNAYAFECDCGAVDSPNPRQMLAEVRDAIAFRSDADAHVMSLLIHMIERHWEDLAEARTLLDRYISDLAELAPNSVNPDVEAAYTWVVRYENLYGDIADA